MVTLRSCLIWQIISFILPPNEYGCVNASVSGLAIDLQKMPVLTKKTIFSDDAFFDLGGYVNKQNCCIWGTEIPHAYIERSMHPKRVTVCCGFWPRGIIRPFFFENEQAEAITVNGDRYWAMLNEFLFIKIKEKILATFGFNMTALSATQPKLHLMFCDLSLKIALSAAEVMSFGHLGATIWHRWTIICGVPSKISVMPTGRRQLTF